MKLGIVPFRWYHIETMDLRADERQHLVDIPNYIDRAKAYQAVGPCFSAIAEGEGVVCAWGFVPLWRGVLEVWMLTSTLVDRYPVQVLRGGQRIIQQSAIDLQAHRLQMTVKASNPIAVRYAAALRFAVEGVLNSYGPDGSDYLMMARIT